MNESPGREREIAIRYGGGQGQDYFKNQESSVSTARARQYLVTKLLSRMSRDTHPKCRSADMDSKKPDWNSKFCGQHIFIT